MPQPAFSNRLLDSLSSATRDRIVAASQLQDLPIRVQLFGNEETPRHLWFLCSGVASVVFTSERGTTIELATLGNEGLIGWLFLLGGQPSPMDCMMQVAGSGYRIPLAVARREFADCAEFRNIVLEYAQHQNILANQLVACNRLHRAEARFARWLLMVQDRIQADTLHMTQEFLSNMLGTRRTTVVEVSAGLQRSGAIESRRGVVRILDREKLVARACECYPRLKTLLDDLYSEK